MVRKESGFSSRITNNIASDNKYWGIFTGFTTDILIENNTTSGSVIQHGIYVSNSRVPNDNPVVRGNIIYGNKKNGIQLNGDCFSGGDGIITGGIIENNFVFSNGWKGLCIISAPNTLIKNNVILVAQRGHY